MRAAWQQLNRLIAELEDEGANLEMDIERHDDRTMGSQRRVQKYVQLIQLVSKAQKFAKSAAI